jgi:preprotein translocase subunit SecD
MVSDPPAVRPAVEAPPARSGKLWLWLGAGALAVVLVAAGVVTAVTTHRRATPRGDVVMTLEARTEPPADALRKAAEVLIARLTGAGYDHPRVTVTGTRSLSVAVGAGGDAQGLRLLAQPGRLSFRAVIAGPTTPYATTVGKGGDVPEAVKAKLGDAYPAAQRLTDPGQVDPAQLAALAPFGRLTPDEVATLPATMQYAVPAITCAQLNGRAPGTIDDPAATVVACERTGDQSKYLLDVAKVTAADVAGAHVELQAAPGWTVTISFTGQGQPKWTALTQAAMTSNPSNQVAIVVDNQVISAPTIQAVITGDAAISGAEIDRTAAARLAALLRSGPLPVTFTVTGVT